MDTRRFVSKTKCELANGMFKIFGDFTNESAGTIQDNLMGWIYDNYQTVEEWMRLMLEHKGISLSGWIENMCNDTTPRDDMCLYTQCTNSG